MSIQLGTDSGAPAVIAPADARKKRNIGVSAMSSRRRLKIRPLRATVIACYTINPTRDEVPCETEQKFTISPALPAALLAAGKSNNEKCTYNTPGVMKEST